jgi:hypothetical protein
MNLLYVGFTHFQIVKDLSNKALMGNFHLNIWFKLLTYRSIIKVFFFANNR